MTQANTMTADTFQYTTADELRELLDDTPTIPELEELLACIPVDLEAYGARMAAIAATDPRPAPTEVREAIVASLMACALPDHEVGAEFAALIDRAMQTTGKLWKTAAERNRAVILADLAEATHARDEGRLSVALGMAPFNMRKYADRIETHVTDNPDATAEEVRKGCIDAMKASATPGAVIDDELAEAILTAMSQWHAIKTETPEQKAIREAFAEARRLIDLHGDEDPRAFSAIIKAIELQDPGCCNRQLKACGIQLPTPTRCTDDGQPLLSLDELAEALNADPADLLERARELEAHGLGVLHISDNTHALQ